MASICQGRSRAAALILSALLLASYAEAANLYVGGSSGWTLPYNYNNWASQTRVKPWDNISKCSGPRVFYVLVRALATYVYVFKYDPRAHNVLLVSQADYYACRTDRPWATYKTGNDWVHFTKSGTYYLICGIPRHCQAGMKVAVKVYW